MRSKALFHVCVVPFASLLFASCAHRGLPDAVSSPSLTTVVADLCTPAAVRLQIDREEFAPENASGTIIDPRGYILTSFRVVGFVDPVAGYGLPGTLHGDGAHVRIGTVGSARDETRLQYLGEVVRGDVRLDLALVRIVSQLDGTPLPEGTRFPTVELAGVADLDVGAPVWVLGFPLRVRTIHVARGGVSGFETSTDGRIAWLRTDAEINPGTFGGMLVDARGRLVAVPTMVSSTDAVDAIALARPVDRIPEEWRTALASGAPIVRADVTGVPVLELPGGEVTDRATGDAAPMGLDELHYFRLSTNDVTHWLSVTARPHAPIFLFDGEPGDVLAPEGDLLIEPGEADGLVIGLVLSRNEDGTTTDVTLRTATHGLGAATPVGSSTP
jgi:S1-C subfamily serine protease